MTSAKFCKVEALEMQVKSAFVRKLKGSQLAAHRFHAA